MAERPRRYFRERGGALLLGAAAAVGLAIAVVGGEAALSTTQFCTSCHSMSYPAEELRKSAHYGALGRDPGCRDCHIPQGLRNLHLALATHVVNGARDLLREFQHDYSDVGKFNARRLEMAQIARLQLKAWDSLTCRSCHENPRPPGKDAQAAHRTMGTRKTTCVDCHQNLVHKSVPETDLDASIAQGKMVLKEGE